MFLTAARTLAAQVTHDDLAHGALYPPLSRIRAVSLEIAIAVAEQAYAEGVAQLKKPASLRNHIAALLYDPTY
jgi:malate dehydrogenase (oxaloacetate-decarboxylating)(NADP+)